MNIPVSFLPDQVATHPPVGLSTDERHHHPMSLPSALDQTICLLIDNEGSGSLR